MQTKFSEWTKFLKICRLAVDAGRSDLLDECAPRWDDGWRKVSEASFAIAVSIADARAREKMKGDE